MTDRIASTPLALDDLFAYNRRLRAAYSRDTTELPDQWTPERPTTGHCHAVAILIQRRFGGSIIQGHAYVGVGDPQPVEHYWNVIEGVTVDLTRDQFPLATPIFVTKLAGPPLAHTVALADQLARAVNRK